MSDMIMIERKIVDEAVAYLEGNSLWDAWYVLKKLGIHRCDCDDPSMEWGEGALLCSRCNGHRWVVDNG